MRFKNKTIVITGAAGFLGSHLCKRLIQNNTIIAIDNLSTGSKSNISKLLKLPNFTFIEHDIIYPIDLEANFILNFACPASPPRYQSTPIQTTKTNVLGIINMLELAKKNNCPILQASTSEVYGDPYQSPQSESYWGNVNPIGIRSCYDEGKRCAETLLFDYHRKYNIAIKVARIFNTYGPNMDKNDGRVVSNFIMQAIENKPITIYGTGKQTRSFCYVDDLIDGIIKFMQVPTKVTGPINLGNPTEKNMLELAKTILTLTKGKSKIVYQEFPQDDPLQRNPDLTLAKKELNWHPKVSLEEGLEKTIAYFQKLQKEGIYENSSNRSRLRRPCNRNMPCSKK